MITSDSCLTSHAEHGDGLCDRGEWSKSKDTALLSEQRSTGWWWDLGTAWR